MRTGSYLSIIQTTYMRTLSLLSLILVPFLGKGQSVQIEEIRDWASVCHVAGDSVQLIMEGKETGLTSSDSISLYVDYADGSGSSLLDKVTPISGDSTFSKAWSYTYSSSGIYDLQLIAEGQSGSSDTAYRRILISDSCESISGKAYLDTSGDCSYGASEPLLTQRTIDLYHNDLPVGKIEIDNSGAYQSQVGANFNYELFLKDTGNFFYSCPPAGTLQVNNLPATGVNFGVTGAVDMTIDYSAVDSSCKQVGDSVEFTLSLASLPITQLDALIYADYGNGFVLEDTIDGTYTSWKHVFDSAGTYPVELSALGPMGGGDTVSMSVNIVDTCYQVSGKVYLDSNDNCVLDSGESLLEGEGVKASLNNSFYDIDITDSNGTYELEVGPNPPYTIEYQGSSTFAPSCPPSGSLQVNTVPNSGINIGLDCKDSNGIFIADLGGLGYAPDTVGYTHFSLEDPICGNDSLTCVKMVFDTNSSYLHWKDSLLAQVQPKPIDTVIGDTLFWDLTGAMSVQDFLSAGAPFFVDSTAPIGSHFTIDLMVCKEGTGPSMLTQTLQGVVSNAWDPNNKRVAPIGSDSAHYIDAGKRLSYTIHFQNTGNAPATDIMIEDTLDPGTLKPHSFQFEYSSHTVDDISIENGHIVRFHYDSIMLPDSGTSQALSKGHLVFSIDQGTGLTQGTVIRNSAAIYFDSNPAIVTNETWNTIRPPLSLQKREEEWRTKLYPNPVDQQLHIQLEKSLEGRITLYDMTGRPVIKEELLGDRKELSLNGLRAGVYFMKIRSDKLEDPITRKVIVE